MKTMKHLLFFTTLICASNAMADLKIPDDRQVVTFYIPSSVNEVLYKIPYPNLSFDVVIQVHERPNFGEADCIAMISSSADITEEKALELLSQIIVEEGGSLQNTLPPGFKNGTMVYNFSPGATFFTRLRVKTKHQKSFYDIKREVLGDNVGLNLRLEYRKGCRGIL